MSTTGRAHRSADPYRDTEVIDERAPRFNQAVVSVVATAGIVLGWPLAWALMGTQILIGLVFGRRWCLPCLAYFELVQPRIGEGRLEDSRAPRLANMMGVGFLLGAALAWWAGGETLGVVIAAFPAVLAALAATTGFCAGCELYRLSARVRGISTRAHHDRVEPSDFDGLGGSPRTILQFTHPLCTECRELASRLRGGPDPLLQVDVRERPELARKYGVGLVPTAVAVGADGVVLERIA